MTTPLDGSAGLVLFTDLDGTVLDERYRAGPAAVALKRLDEAGVTVVWCSSKTRLEQEALRAELGATGPFIVENGSAVLLPGAPPDLPRWHGYGLERLGVAAEQVRTALAGIRERLHLDYRGFFEMGVDDVAAVTGLARAAAARARQRDFSETLVGLTDEARAVLEPELDRLGLRIASGGRFHTVTGAQADKGAALRWLMVRLRGARSGEGLRSVAVGDSENDLPMLAAADRAYLVGRSDGRPVAVEPPLAVARLTGVGPHGFAEMVDSLLAEPGLRR